MEQASIWGGEFIYCLVPEIIGPIREQLRGLVHVVVIHLVVPAEKKVSNVRSSSTGRNGLDVGKTGI